MAALDLLQELVEIESPSYSPGVRRVAEICARELEAIGARTEFVGVAAIVGERGFVRRALARVCVRRSEARPRACESSSWAEASAMDTARHRFSKCECCCRCDGR